MERDVADPGLRNRQAVVELHPGSASYRVNGDFTHAGKQAAAPLVQVGLPKPLAIMGHQVSSADYQRCVDDGACRALDRGVVVAADRPAVQISWHDANGYAAWLSRKTGETWRLPTDEEWAFAAGSKFKDDGVPSTTTTPQSAGSPATSARLTGLPPRPVPERSAAFGTNENGLQDVGGNVWEWTAPASSAACSTMPARSLSESPNCGVRVVEGQHRAYVTDFIRDAKAGGCAVGVPPDNLGFRLVVEQDKWPGVQRLVTRVKAFL